MSRIVELSSMEDEEHFINNHNHCVVFFGSKNCGHCRQFASNYQELSTKYPHVAFAHVELTRVEVVGVGPVPMFVGYKSGVTDDKYFVLGASKSAVNEMLEKLLK